MEVKGRHLITVAVLIVVFLAVFFGGFIYLNKTAQKRAYIKQIETMRLVHEHQQLKIEIYEQQKRLAQINAEKEAKIPVLELSPSEKKEKQEAIERMNK